MDTEETQGKQGIYEASFLLAPIIAEENVVAEFEAIKSAITKAGGTFISEDSPKLRPLAYEMPKVVAGQKYNFDQAYFGWVKFELSAEKIADVKTAMDRNDNIVRSLIITTVRENTMFTQKMTFRPTTGPEADKKTPEGEAIPTPISAEELDKTIDNLIVE